MPEPIHEAAQRGDVEALGRELASGVSPNALDSDGQTPLHYLCNDSDNPRDSDDDAEAQVACVRMLLEAGANVNAPAEYPAKGRSTPLLYAAGMGNAKVVAALLEGGADVNRGNAFGDSPLHWACMRMDSDVEPAWVLIKNGAAVNARDCVGETPLDRRPWTRRLVPILLRAGATPSAHTTNAYIQKVIAAGGFRDYERNHLNALVATFAPKFDQLPKELVRLVVEYRFHVGYY